MKGDLAFEGFLLTADEWQGLDDEMRGTLVAIATRRADPWFDHLGAAPAPAVEPLAEGSGALGVEDVKAVELAAAADLLADPMAGLDDVPLTRAVDREA